jgi:hypothetical protein
MWIKLVIRGGSPCRAPSPCVPTSSLSSFAAWRGGARTPPRPVAYCRWWLCDLGQWLRQEFRVSVSMQTLSRELRAIGYRKLSARPKHHAQAIGAIEAFKKTSPPRWQASRASRASAPTR